VPPPYTAPPHTAPLALDCERCRVAEWPPAFRGAKPTPAPAPDAPTVRETSRAADGAAVTAGGPSAGGATRGVADGGSVEVYVGNVAVDVGAAQLLELLILAGPADIRLPRAADGAHRGFAFGTFGHVAVAKYAVRLLDGLVLGGQPLKVRLSHHQLQQQQQNRGQSGQQPPMIH
jgi:hypothetical protein